MGLAKRCDKTLPFSSTGSDDPGPGAGRLGAAPQRRTARAGTPGRAAGLAAVRAVCAAGRAGSAGSGKGDCGAVADEPGPAARSMQTESAGGCARPLSP